LKVPRCFDEKIGVMLEASKAVVATIAEKTANLACLVVVVNM